MVSCAQIICVYCQLSIQLVTGPGVEHLYADELLYTFHVFGNSNMQTYRTLSPSCLSDVLSRQGS